MASSQNRNRFEQLVDEVIHKPLEQIDWMTTLKIRNMVKKREVGPKYALGVLKQKLFSTNAVTAYHALEILENLVDYSGPEFQEVLTRKSNCKMLTQLVVSTRHEQVQLKLLDLIRFWTDAFGEEPKHKYIKKAKDILQRRGYEFPEIKFNYAPGFRGGGRYLREQEEVNHGITTNDFGQRAETCKACDLIIRPTERMHHCRDCREIFCYRCAPAISRLGVEEEEVLCDNCYTPAAANLVQIFPSAPPSDNRTGYMRAPTEEVPDSQMEVPPPLPPRTNRTASNTPAKTEEELEEEQFQLAVALSRAEAEEREMFLAATMIAESSSQSAIQSSNQPPHQSASNGTPYTQLTEDIQNELTCGICYTYFEEATTLSCSHSFCYECISSWRQEHNDCPMCRKNIMWMAPCRALDNMVAAILKSTTTNDTGSSPASSQSPNYTINVQNNAAPQANAYGRQYEYVEEDEEDDFDDSDHEWEEVEEEDHSDNECIEERGRGYDMIVATEFIGWFDTSVWPSRYIVKASRTTRTSYL